MIIRLPVLMAFICITLSCCYCKAEDQPRPELLVQMYCIGCHNHNDAEGGLSLGSTASILEGTDGESVLDSQNPKDSRLFQVLIAGADSSMPPEGEPQPSDNERAILKEWVQKGATLDAGLMVKSNLTPIVPVHKKSDSLVSSIRLANSDSVVVAGTRALSLFRALSEESVWNARSSTDRIWSLSSANSKPWFAVAGGLPGADGVVEVLSIQDGSLVHSFAGHSDSVYSAVFNHDDSVIATGGYDRRILLHDLGSGEVVHSLAGHNGAVFDLAFSSNGKVLCSASADGTVKVWDAAKGVRLDTLSQPQAEQYSVLVSPDDNWIYAAGADNRIRVWKLVSVDRPQINPIVTSRFAHEEAITSLALSQDGKLLASTAEDGTLQVWTTVPLKHHQTLAVQESLITSMLFLDHQSLLVTRMDGTKEVLAVRNTNEEHDGSDTIANTMASAHVEDGKETEKLNEAEPNNQPENSQSVSVPCEISGSIHADNKQDADYFRFAAKHGESLLIEVNAQRSKSPLDSHVEILDQDGQRIVQTKLQAVRDSYFTFRGKDSSTTGDFRVFNWQEMELNEYLYSDGEVVKLWLYPRGPDSGFTVYPGRGSRFTYFNTTPTSHALQAPCYVVVPYAPSDELIRNGLPVFSVFAENDDDPRREWGTDSRLLFKAPHDGEFLLRISDARGFSGPDHKYTLAVRHPRPGYSVSVGGRKLKMHAGTGRELVFNARRIDGYEGPITVSIENLPHGFGTSGPTTIQSEQLQCLINIFATDQAVNPSKEDIAAITINASAVINGKEVVQKLPGIEELMLAENPKLRVVIAPENSETDSSSAGLPVIEVYPGQTTRAFVNLERVDFGGIVSFGKEDSGRNLPHGVFVDNIGLNGLLIPADQSRREFFITAAKWVSEQTRTFYLKSNVDGGVTSLPVTVKIMPRRDSSVREVTQVP